MAKKNNNLISSKDLTKLVEHANDKLGTSEVPYTLSAKYYKKW